MACDKLVSVPRHILATIEDLAADNKLTVAVPKFHSSDSQRLLFARTGKVQAGYQIENFEFVGW